MLPVQRVFINLPCSRWNTGLASKSFFPVNAAWDRLHGAGHVKWVLKDEQGFAKPDCTTAKDLAH